MAMVVLSKILLRLISFSLPNPIQHSPAPPIQIMVCVHTLMFASRWFKGSPTEVPRNCHWGPKRSQEVSRGSQGVPCLSLFQLSSFRIHVLFGQDAGRCW